MSEETGVRYTAIYKGNCLGCGKQLTSRFRRDPHDPHMRPDPFDRVCGCGGHSTMRFSRYDATITPVAYGVCILDV